MPELIDLSRRKFIYTSSCACASSLLFSSCTEVAMSERKQLIIYPDDFLYSKAYPVYNNFKSKSKLITGTSEYDQIIEVSNKIRHAINMYYDSSGKENPTSNFQWEIILVDDNQTKNAWCMPGGKIAFYSGILPIAKNTDGIASIMGHEIAHAVARHTAERASVALVTNLGTSAFEAFVLKKRLPRQAGYIRSLGIDLPFNRKQESEADYLGFIFMSLAGFDTKESYKVWERMKEDMGGKGPAEFWSTHPSPDNRIKKLKEWIPIVKAQYPAIKT